jgi:hypothetical protein
MSTDSNNYPDGVQDQAQRILADPTQTPDKPFLGNRTDLESIGCRRLAQSWMALFRGKISPALNLSHSEWLP